jgi:hypothetical protein
MPQMASGISSAGKKPLRYRFSLVVFTGTPEA